MAFFRNLTAIDLMLVFEQTTTNVLTPIGFLALGLTSGSLLSLAAVFPQSPRVIDRFPLLRFLGYVPGLTAAAIAIVALYDRSNPWAYTAPVGWLMLLIAISAGLYFLSLLYRRWRSDSPVVRQQSRIILWGSLLWRFQHLSYGLRRRYSTRRPRLNRWCTCRRWSCFRWRSAQPMQRYNLLNIDRLITGGLTYVIISAGMALIYLGLLAGLTVALQSAGLAHQ